jgi:hypothetical protein
MKTLYDVNPYLRIFIILQITVCLSVNKEVFNESDFTDKHVLWTLESSQYFLMVFFFFFKEYV